MQELKILLSRSYSAAHVEFHFRAIEYPEGEFRGDSLSEVRIGEVPRNN